MLKKCECQYCGKEFLKEECDIKRGSGKFCSLKCAYASRVKNYKVDENLFNEKYNKHLGMLKVLAGKYDEKYFDEMLQEARIVLWKCLSRKIKGKFSTYLYKAVKNQLKLYYHRTLKNKFWQIYQNEMLEDREKKYHYYFENSDYIDKKIDCQSILNELKNTNLTKNEKMVCEYEFGGYIFDDFAKIKKIENKKLTSILYYGRKTLQKKYLLLKGA